MVGMLKCLWLEDFSGLWANDKALKGHHNSSLSLLEKYGLFTTKMLKVQLYMNNVWKGWASNSFILHPKFISISPPIPFKLHVFITHNSFYERGSVCEIYIQRSEDDKAYMLSQG